MKFSRILVLAPHTDDGEFGCGGGIRKFIEEGKNVYYAAFSLAEESVPEGLPKNILEVEVKKATRVIGIKKDNLLLYRYPVRKLAAHRQDVLEDLVMLKKEIEPDLVFMPSPNDLHQDHYTVAMEGLRAFKQTSILGYELPWNNITFNTVAFISLNEGHVAKKIEAIKQYESQSHKNYVREDFIRGWAKTRGVQIGTDFAETFDVLRWIIQ